jgi:hypothetical protein
VRTVMNWAFETEGCAARISITPPDVFGLCDAVNQNSHLNSTIVDRKVEREMAVRPIFRFCLFKSVRHQGPLHTFVSFDSNSRRGS